MTESLRVSQRFDEHETIELKGPAAHVRATLRVVLIRCHDVDPLQEPRRDVRERLPAIRDRRRVQRPGRSPERRGYIWLSTRLLQEIVGQPHETARAA